MYFLRGKTPSRHIFPAINVIVNIAQLSPIYNAKLTKYLVLCRV